MSEYVSDKEQIEMIKTWWRENGKFTIISIVTAITLSSGWKYYEHNKQQKVANASSLYEQMLNHEANRQYSTVEFDATNLQTNYSQTPYALLAAFMSAQNAVNENRFNDAIGKLNWVISNSHNRDFKQIAKIRKARILLADKKYEEALNTLANLDSKSYLPLVNEVRGDIFSAQKDYAQARFHYQTALNALPKDAPGRQLLQIKYNQLESN